MNNIIITGISGGIGECTAKKLLEAGHSVIGIDMQYSENLKELEKSYPEELVLYTANLLETDNVKKMIELIVSEQGKIGGFVHCAGFDKLLPIHMVKQEDFEKLWRIHALVPMLMISSICKKNHYLQQCSIVLISSQSAHEGAMGHTAYASAKGAIEGFLAPAAAELMEKGIRINEVCFAPIKTGMSEEWMNRLPEEGKKRLEENYPLGIGKPEDAGSLICYLLSPESRFINGQIITADGGHMVRKV